MTQRLPNAVGADGLLRFLFFFKLSDDPLALVGRKPVRLAGPVGQVEKRDQAEDNGGGSFQDGKTSPTPHAEPGQNEQHPGARGAEDVGKREGGGEDGARLFAGSG